MKLREGENEFADEITKRARNYHVNWRVACAAVNAIDKAEKLLPGTGGEAVVLLSLY